MLPPCAPPPPPHVGIRTVSGFRFPNQKLARRWNPKQAGWGQLRWGALATACFTQEISLFLLAQIVPSISEK